MSPTLKEAPSAWIQAHCRQLRQLRVKQEFPKINKDLIFTLFSPNISAFAAHYQPLLNHKAAENRVLEAQVRCLVDFKLFLKC